MKTIWAFLTNIHIYYYYLYIISTLFYSDYFINLVTLLIW